ncbi:hypothetical protein AB0P17_38580 [Streptomyces sp. NPDC088124]|uniref:COG4315 family predicted lipoprotein n=1 Tax=Streptomyces sp. NPDC088124 TaxID=3154654 RepID=UPI00342B2F74
MKSNTRAVTAMAAAALCAVALAGCSGSDSASESAREEAPAEAAASASMSMSTSPSALPTELEGKVNAKELAPYGKILVNGRKRTLYLFAADKTKESTCMGDCAKVWRPVLVTSGVEPKAGTGGVKQSLLSTITRTDNTKQVTYNGHPLYTYKADNVPGEARGQDLTEFGAKWYVVDTAGNKVTTPPPSASPTGTMSPTAGMTGTPSPGASY